MADLTKKNFFFFLLTSPLINHLIILIHFIIEPFTFCS